MAVRTPQGSQKVRNRPKQTPPTPSTRLPFHFSQPASPSDLLHPKLTLSFAVMVTAAACVLTKQGAKKPPFCTRTTSFRWIQLHVGSVHLDVLEALKLSKSCAKPSWPPSTTLPPNCISFCVPIFSERQQQLSCPGQKAGGSLAHRPPLTTPLHSYPISYLILSVLSSPYLSNLLSVSSTH